MTHDYCCPGRTTDLGTPVEDCKPPAEPEPEPAPPAPETAAQRARRIADRLVGLPERLHWEQHRDDVVLVLTDEFTTTG